MEFFKNLKRRFGMAKRFKGGIKEDIVSNLSLRVAEEDKEHEEALRKIVERFIKSKEEFLISKNLHERPNSHMAIKAWEEYCEESKPGIPFESKSGIR
jgi:hypothetical protein